MFRIKPVGFRETRRKLNRLFRGFDGVASATIKRLVVTIIEEARIDQSYVRFVESRSQGKRFFGFSIDPNPEMMRVEDLEGFAILVFIRDPENSKMMMLAEGSPWSIDMMPVLPDPGEGFLLYRDSTDDELEEIRRRNREYLRRGGKSLVDSQASRTLIQRMSNFSSGIRMLDSDTMVLADDDLRYNQARAEFGIGVSPSPVLRLAIRKSIESRIQDAFEGIVIDVAEGRDPEKGLPNFERVSSSWLEENKAFMGLIVPDII